MTVSIKGVLAKLLMGTRSTRVAQIVGISFLEHVLNLVHAGHVVDLSILRSGVLREDDAEIRIKEADAAGKEAEAEAKRAEAMRITVAVERERVELKKAEIQLEEAALRVAEKKGELAAKEAREKLAQAKAERIHAAEEVLIEKLTNLRMKGGSLSVSPAELMKLIEQLGAGKSEPEAEEEEEEE